MNASRKRLLMYLLLNAVVSACVTIGILFVYDHYFRPTLLPQPASVPSSGVDAFEITTIIGAGIPSNEIVLLRNVGPTVASLKDWKLQDDNGNAYTFPDVNVLPSGAVQLHTAPGQNTLVDLYWGLSASVWRSGQSATLYDASGVVRSVYNVP